MLTSTVGLLVVFTFILGLTDCVRRSPESRSFPQLSAIEAPDAAEFKICEEKLPEAVCTGNDCARVRLLTDIGDTLHFVHNSASQQPYNYGSGTFKQTIEHAALLTECVTKNWHNNGRGAYVGDVSDAQGLTPAGRHPAGTHDKGMNADVGYFQMFRDDNNLRPICDSYSDNHCNSATKYLDAYKTAVFIAAIHKQPNLRVIGVDGQAEMPIINATKELCDMKIIKGNACDGLKVFAEVTDTGKNWFRFHHHHLHISIGPQPVSPIITIKRGITDPSVLWSSGSSPALVADENTLVNNDDVTVKSPKAPKVSDVKGTGAFECFVGWRQLAKGERVCAAWTTSDLGGPVRVFIPYETETCDAETLAVHLPRRSYLDLTQICTSYQSY